MLLTKQIITLLGISSLATAWNIEVFEGEQCSGKASPYYDTGPACITHGGKGWAVEDVDGCIFTSWSGNDCRGSSTLPAKEEECENVLFGSIKVEC
jgi:hypothetical protein